MTNALPLIWPAMAAAFLASLVEAVEALTVVLAVATVRGWRPAGSGALAGLAILAVIVVAWYVTTSWVAGFQGSSGRTVSNRSRTH